MEEKTLFYATGNKSKLHNMYYRLRNFPIKVLCPDDLNIHIEVEENGSTATENAVMKASAYFDVVKIPTIAGDSGMYIEGIPDEDQPGLYVRRVNGRALSDDEMIDYYAGLAKNAKTDCFIHYFTGIALVTEKGTVTMELNDAPLKLSPVPNTNRTHRGNPLDSVTLLEDGRFFNDLSDEERVAWDGIGEQNFTNFILSNLL